ncbi:unnamed protein product [Brachionus calyciflorus]|uniref:COMM domain-containing protein 5 n=1 Tax=Brachionus calyciflorus TaxID=104777 RepID=A0A813PUK8_9BILA|nr:unnamed protein product [Brachionus calyciflorus]
MSAKINSNYDRTPFWGAKTTKELKYLQQALNKKIPSVSISKSCFRELLKIMIQCANGEDENKNFSDRLTIIADHFVIPENEIVLLLSSLLRAFQLATKIASTKQEIIKEDLIESLKIPSEFAEDFVNILHGPKRQYVERSLANKCPKNVFIEKIDWRIDVSLSTSSLNRTMESSVQFQLCLSDGKIILFEANLHVFHLLRFNVALVLKEMDDILNRQLFKIVD